MGTFTTKIKLGNIGFVVRCDYNNYECYVKEMEVGKVQVEQYHPKANRYNDPIYVEKYMCFETGVGSGTIYIYGEHIFANKEDAINIGIVKMRQKMYKEIAAREEWLAKRAVEEKEWELRQLEQLKAKYENVEDKQ